MFPYFYLFGKLISVYALLSLVGILLAGAFAYRQARRKGLDTVEMTVLLLVSVFAGWAGSHLTYALVNFENLKLLFANLSRIPSWSVFFQLFQYVFGGAVFYGGLILGIPAGLLYGKKRRLDTGAYADVVAPAIPLFHAFGRIGCFLGGCCYGVECRVGFIYRQSVVEEANGVRRFPIQLVEAFFNFALFFFLWHLLKKDKGGGKLLSLYLCLYALVRFTLEFWRGDEVRGFIFGLSTSQFLSLVTLAIGLAGLLTKGKKKEELNSK